MPFKSQAQRKWMFANKPEMAHEWAAHTPKGKKLPEHVKEAAYASGVSFAFNELGYVKTAVSNKWVQSLGLSGVLKRELLRDSSFIPARVGGHTATIVALPAEQARAIAPAVHEAGRMGAATDVAMQGASAKERNLLNQNALTAIKDRLRMEGRSDTPFLNAWKAPANYNNGLRGIETLQAPLETTFKPKPVVHPADRKLEAIIPKELYTQKMHPDRIHQYIPRFG